MPDDPLDAAVRQLRIEMARTAGREQQIARLYEDAILQIRLSAALQRERLQTYIDGATLAAFQVHSIQIKFLENPPPLTGWAFWGDILHTFALDSTLVGKLLGGVTTKFFSRIAVQRATLLALPRSTKGKELVKRAKAVGGAPEKHYPRVEEVVRPETGEKMFATWPTIDRDKGVLLKMVPPGKQKEAVEAALSKTDVKDWKELYHSAIGRFVAGESNAEKNIIAVFKAQKRGSDIQKGRSNAPLATADSPTAYLLSAVQQYASVLRYNLEVELAQVENLIRGRHIEVEALEPLLAAWPLDALDTSVESSGEPADLESLRQRYALAFECVMWAKLYGFDAENPPMYEQNNAAIKGVTQGLVDYWIKRLLPVTDEYKRNSSDTLHPSNKVVRLQEYMVKVGQHLSATGAPAPV